ncbi:MAG TPA: hypothetical protein VGH02_11725 [Rhizomicrobium sp.]|jgi:hypothetical protein
MTHLGFIETTQTFAATDEAGSFTVAGPSGTRRAFIVTADVVVHLARNAAATTDSMMIPANTPVSISAFGGDSIGYVKGDGEDDGSLYVTLTDR